MCMNIHFMCMFMCSIMFSHNHSGKTVQLFSFPRFFMRMDTVTVLPTITTKCSCILSSHLQSNSLLIIPLTSPSNAASGFVWRTCRLLIIFKQLQQQIKLKRSDIKVAEHKAVIVQQMAVFLKLNSGCISSNSCGWTILGCVPGTYSTKILVQSFALGFLAVEEVLTFNDTECMYFVFWPPQRLTNWEGLIL